MLAAHIFSCAGYSFHWFEAIVMFINSVVEIFIFPMPAALHKAYEIWVVLLSISCVSGPRKTPGHAYLRTGPSR